MTKTINMITCGKCKGAGFLSEYAGIAQGVCFRCNGTGQVKAPTAATIAKKEAKAAAEAARREAHIAAYNARVAQAMTVYGNDSRVLNAHRDYRDALALELFAKHGA